MAVDSKRDTLSEIDCSSGALRSNVEGNLPNYVLNVLRGGGYIGKPLEIVGYFLESPQKTVLTKLDDAKVSYEVIKLGSIRTLELTGDIKGSNFAIKKGGKYHWQNKRSPNETKFTKVVEIKSGDLEREFFVDAEVPFLDQWE